VSALRLMKNPAEFARGGRSSGGPVELRGPIGCPVYHATIGSGRNGVRATDGVIFAPRTESIPMRAGDLPLKPREIQRNPTAAGFYFVENGGLRPIADGQD